MKYFYTGATRSLNDVLAADVATSKKAVELMRQYDQTSDASLTLSFQGTASISTSISSESGDRRHSSAVSSNFDKRHQHSNNINKKNNSDNDNDSDNSNVSDDYSYIAPLTSNVAKAFKRSKKQETNKAEERRFFVDKKRDPAVANFQFSEIGRASCRERV